MNAAFVAEPFSCFLMSVDIRDTPASYLVREKKFVVTCSPEATLQEALEAMQTVNVSGLPIFSPVPPPSLVDLSLNAIYTSLGERFPWICLRLRRHGLHRLLLPLRG